MITRRNFLKRYGIRRGIELASAIPLIGVLFKNAADNGRYNEINYENAISQKKSAAVEIYAGIHPSFSASLENLVKVYNDKYYNSHTEISTGMDMKGNLNVTTRTVWEWEEPDNVPDHKVIAAWRNNQNTIGKRSDNLVSGKLLDCDKVGEIYVEDAYTNRTFQIIMSGIVFGGEAALLLGYEELMALKGYHDRFPGKKRDMSLGKIVEMTNSPEQLARRAFLKIGSGLVAAGTAYLVDSANKNRFNKERYNLESELLKMKGIGNYSDEVAFGRYFGETPKEYIIELEGKLEILRESIKSRIEEKEVAAAMEDTVSKGTAYVKQLKEYFTDGIPKEMGIFAKDGLFTDYIGKLKMRSGGTDLILEGLAVGAVLAGTLIPGEIYNSMKSEEN
ncbi:MAG: hypothetical protein ABIC04_01150 [Nanoarchaeota archaeon]